MKTLVLVESYLQKPQSIRGRKIASLLRFPFSLSPQQNADLAVARFVDLGVDCSYMVDKADDAHQPVPQSMATIAFRAEGCTVTVRTPLGVSRVVVNNSGIRGYSMVDGQDAAALSQREITATLDQAKTIRKKATRAERHANSHPVNSPNLDPAGPRVKPTPEAQQATSTGLSTTPRAS